MSDRGPDVPRLGHRNSPALQREVDRRRAEARAESALVKYLTDRRDDVRRRDLAARLADEAYLRPPQGHIPGPAYYDRWRPPTRPRPLPRIAPEDRFPEPDYDYIVAIGDPDEPHLTLPSTVLPFVAPWDMRILGVEDKDLYRARPERVARPRRAVRA